ncbi:hypothetical protein [Acidihalobacter ferrooxydans]|uniref:Uncharacterized protein n=1 Tax=Acidihalobacter ferrooxydans TaxID=1765967 RepID=A0A1P8UD15_9GAMM|nr:hypothetical protein [Acidihalobacter ferrooxydans]APZ41761.1 hypothetical protein BW247_00510 [Acidihalobacter ferrooxydans]
MRIETQDKQHVTIVMDDHRAGDLLAGLLAHPDLGEAASELVEKLRAAKVEPTPAPDHIRHEYAPPLQD